MKKRLWLLSIVMVVLLAGCTGGKESGDLQKSERQSSVRPNDSSLPGDKHSGTSKGEPTFLVGADGLPIFTSEITKAAAVDPSSDFDGDFSDREINADELDEGTFTTVTCEGFAYVHDSRINVLAAEEPDKFENGVYKGDELLPSKEYRRLYAGDKVGELTVKSAETIFTSSGEFAEYGNYLGWSSIYYDGELTITGYLSIYENPLYQDGLMILLPTESPLPQMIYQYSDGLGISHAPVLGDGYYSETAAFNLGYLDDTKADTSGLAVGDTNIKVRAVIGDIRSGSGAAPTILGELLDIKIL